LNSRAIAELPQVLAASASMSDAETQLLDALYRGAIDESELTRALQLVQDMFQCRSGAFVSFDARAPAADLSMVSGIFNEYGRLYLEQFVAIDPAPLFFSASPPERLRHPIVSCRRKSETPCPSSMSFSGRSD
jgi:hypothetical protein